MDTIKLLDELAEVYSARDLAELQKQELINRVITPEIKARIAEIEAEFAPLTDAASKRAAELESQIKDQTLAAGTTVKGAHVQAVYAKGRVSWDTKALDGYAAAHPEIERFRKVGEPSISIRKVG